MAELQRTLAAERARSDRLAVEARRQGVEETLIALGRQNQVKEVRGKIIKLFNLKFEQYDGTCLLQAHNLSSLVHSVSGFRRNGFKHRKS